MADIPILDIVKPQGGGPMPPEARAKFDAQWLTLMDNMSSNMRQPSDGPPQAFRSSEDAPARPVTSPPVPIGRTLDMVIPRKYTDLAAPKVRLRVMWPPSSGGKQDKLPCVLYIHGGGWALGNINSEIHIATRMCVNANAVVVKFDYRQAPENPFPAAVEDCWEVMQWIVEDARAPNGGVLGIDEKRIAITGASAGGNLAIILSHMLVATLHAPENFQLKLVLPVVPLTDFTAGDSTSGSSTWNNYPVWQDNFYFTNLYLPNKHWRLNWHASPILAPDEHFKDLPPVHVTVAELDPLCDQGLAYANKCAAHGVIVTTKVYKGLPHPAIAMDANVDAARQWIQDLCDVLKVHFWD